MKFLLDMNLSPDWLNVFTAEGWNAKHWSTIGEHRATDEIIM
jgi:predicted nuclease of predicted toxin-antitoxin system